MPNTFQPDDTDNVILRKILTAYGGEFFAGDLDYRILWKILEQVGAVPFPGDTYHDLWRKLLTKIADDLSAPANSDQRALPGDLTYALVRKLVVWHGGNPLPGDTFNNLLRKYLTQLP